MQINYKYSYLKEWASHKNWFIASITLRQSCWPTFSKDSSSKPLPDFSICSSVDSTITRLDLLGERLSWWSWGSSGSWMMGESPLCPGEGGWGVALWASPLAVLECADFPLAAFPAPMDCSVPVVLALWITGPSELLLCSASQFPAMEQWNIRHWLHIVMLSVVRQSLEITDTPWQELQSSLSGNATHLPQQISKWISNPSVQVCKT